MSATMRQQQLSAWEQLMQKYPTINLILQALGDALGYVVHGHFIVDLGRWVILTSGRISETALLFATLWVTAASVAPNYVSKLPGGLADMLSNLSLMALTLLPEIILFSAIITCYHHWRAAFVDQTHRYEHGVWAVLYSLPTLTFFGMTALTISTFVSIGHTTSAPQWALTARCLAGWSYGLIGLIRAGITKRTAPKFETMSALSAQLTTADRIEERSAEDDASDETNVEEEDTRSQQGQGTTCTQMEADKDQDSITFQQSTGAPTGATNAHAKPARGAGVKKAETIMKRNPTITPAELAKKAGISQPYARKLLTAKQPTTQPENEKNA